MTNDGRSASGRPAGQELDRVVLRCAGLRGEDRQNLVPCRVHTEVLEGQGHLAYRRVPEGLDPRLVRSDVVGGLAGTEGAAAGGEGTEKPEQGRGGGTGAGPQPQRG